MAINRRFLYAGLFLVALGGVVVVADLAMVDSSALSNVLRLWPLAWIAIGAGIVLRRSRFALVAGILAAMVPGLVLGGFAVAAPRHGFDCAEGGGATQTRTQGGTAPVIVHVDANCGSIAIGTQPGNAWQLTSTNATGALPDVQQTGGVLQISSSGGADWDWLDGARDSWNLTLPTTTLEQVRLSVNAGRVTGALPGANIGSLMLDGNAAEIAVDASTATLQELDGSVDFGRLSIQLPQKGGYSGSVRISAGELRLCVPYGLGLHVDFAGSAREVRVNGLHTDGQSWENELYQSTTNRADLSVKVNFGSVAINPVLGGCK